MLEGKYQTLDGNRLVVRQRDDPLRRNAEIARDFCMYSKSRDTRILLVMAEYRSLQKQNGR